MFHSPVSSDSLEEPSSDGLLDEVMLRKNVLKTLISVTCRRAMGVPETTPINAQHKNQFFNGNGNVVILIQVNMFFNATSEPLILDTTENV